MKNQEAQITWAAAGYYTGGIDGVIGPKSRDAMRQILLNTQDRDNVYAMSVKRQIIACAQICLNKLGYEAGTVDGYAGHNTRNALDGLLFKLATGKREVIERKANMVIATVGIPKQSELDAFYGNPETEVPNRLKTVKLPFRLRIDYNMNQSTNKITLHEKCADSAVSAIVAVRDHYGDEEYRRLGLDRYAGGYNKRKMRGGSKWSTHAYGCAKDWYARPNGLRTRCPEALFCAPEYRPFLDIMQEHDWLPAIRLWGADAMHFQQCVLG